MNTVSNRLALSTSAKSLRDSADASTTGSLLLVSNFSDLTSPLDYNTNRDLSNAGLVGALSASVRRLVPSPQTYAPI